jgi:two-component system response regulator
VEDNPGDVRLFRDVLTECRRAVQLSVLSSGADVLPFLRQEGRYAQVPCPRLIFLDLGLPGAPGASVLAEIRADPALADIAVVIFSGMPAAHESAPALVGAQGWIDKNMPLWELWYTLTTVLEHL